MKNNKLITIMLIILIAITLVGTVALILVLKYTGDNSSEPSIDEVLASSVDITEVTTNLASDEYIRISFKIQTDSKSTKKELEKRNFQVKNIIIHTLSELSAEELEGAEGKRKLEENLQKQINEIMDDGKIERVYITDSLLQ